LPNVHRGAGSFVHGMKEILIPFFRIDTWFYEMTLFSAHGIFTLFASFFHTFSEEFRYVLYSIVFQLFSVGFVIGAQ